MMLYDFFFVPEECSFEQLLFLVVIYGYILYHASELISNGSELLLLVPSLAHIVGTIVLPVLAAVPDGLMIFFSGNYNKGNSKGNDNSMYYQDDYHEDDYYLNQKILVGMGTLAGSTIMLLTIPWFLAVLGGRVDLDSKGNGDYKTNRKTFAKNTIDNMNHINNMIKGDGDFFNSLFYSLFYSFQRRGVNVTEIIKQNAYFIILSSISYLIVLIPTVFAEHDSSTYYSYDNRNHYSNDSYASQAKVESPYVLIACISSSVLYVVYLWLQIVQDQEQIVEDTTNDCFQHDNLRNQNMNQNSILLRGENSLHPVDFDLESGNVEVIAPSRGTSIYESKRTSRRNSQNDTTNGNTLCVEQGPFINGRPTQVRYGETSIEWIHPDQSSCISDQHDSICISDGCHHAINTRGDNGNIDDSGNMTVSEERIIDKIIESIRRREITLRGALVDMQEGLLQGEDLRQGEGLRQSRYYGTNVQPDSKKQPLLQEDALSNTGSILRNIPTPQQRESSDTTSKANIPNLLSIQRRARKILAPFFKFYDRNRDGTIDFEEFKSVMYDLHERTGKFRSESAQKSLFDAGDLDQNGTICFEEFVYCMLKLSSSREWRIPRKAVENNVMIEGNSKDQQKSEHLNCSVNANGIQNANPNCNSLYALILKDDDDHLERVRRCDSTSSNTSEDSIDSIPEDLLDLSPEQQQFRIKLRAFSTLAFGTLVTFIFSDPAVGVLAEVGKRMNISPFYVSFILAPIASNASELVAAYCYARKRTIRSMTISLSTLEGAACMNNTFCLSIFLYLIYTRKMAWQFTAETIAILFVEISVAIIALRSTTHTIFSATVILMLFPISLALVWALENILGID